MNGGAGYLTNPVQRNLISPLPTVRTGNSLHRGNGCAPSNYKIVCCASDGRSQQYRNMLYNTSNVNSGNLRYHYRPIDDGQRTFHEPRTRFGDYSLSNCYKKENFCCENHQMNMADFDRRNFCSNCSKIRLNKDKQFRLGADGRICGKCWSTPGLETRDKFGADIIRNCYRRGPTRCCRPLSRPVHSRRTGEIVLHRYLAKAPPCQICTGAVLPRSGYYRKYGDADDGNNEACYRDIYGASGVHRPNGTPADHIY